MVVLPEAPMAPNTAMGDQWRVIDDGELVWVNYNDLTATSLESWLTRGIIPKWP